MGFLDNYETVNQKVKRLHATWPNNRIETRIVEFSASLGYVLVECKVFRNYEDEKPSAIDFAFGRVEAYNPSMKRWFVEDTVSSAIGRAASVLLGTDEKPSRENMEHVEQMPAKFVNDPWTVTEAPAIVWEDGFTTSGQAITELQEKLGAEVIEESPKCKHGHMIKRESKPDSGKDWAGYFCTEKTKATQCDPIWLIRSATTGQWRMKREGEK